MSYLEKLEKLINPCCMQREQRIRMLKDEIQQLRKWCAEILTENYSLKHHIRSFSESSSNVEVKYDITDQA